MAAVIPMISGPYPAAAVRLSLDDQDLTARIAPRLIELSLSEARNNEADQLDIRLSDHDGQLAIPPHESPTACPSLPGGAGS